METNTFRLYSLSYREARTYLLASLFVVGNLLLPQLAHLVPQGGLIFLPIYFFTLIGAFKYGWQVGLLTAVLSPVVNYLLFGMPPLAVLPAILIKSVLLAVSASLAATYFKRLSVVVLLLVVVAYQFTGTLFEWGLTGSIYTALQDFRLGIPGMFIQVFGGYLLLKRLRN